MTTQARWKQAENTLNIIRPYIQADGGDVELCDIREDHTVVVRLTGNCVGCGSSEVTLANGIEATLMSHLPWVKAVIHQEGEQTTNLTAASATGQLSSMVRNIEDRMRSLEFDVVGQMDGNTLPPSAREWPAWIRAETARLQLALNTCVFPVAAIFVPCADQTLATLEAAMNRFDQTLQAFDTASQACRADDSTATYDVLAAVQPMLRALQDYLLRLDGVLFEVLDEVLPDELRSELRIDISNLFRRHVSTMVGTAA